MRTWRRLIRFVRKSLSLFVNPDNTSQDGNTPLLLAATFGHLEVVKVLVKHGAKVNRVNEVSLRYINKLKYFSDRYFTNEFVLEIIAVVSIYERIKCIV